MAGVRLAGRKTPWHSWQSLLSGPAQRSAAQKHGSAMQHSTAHQVQHSTAQRTRPVCSMRRWPSSSSCAPWSLGRIVCTCGVKKTKGGDQEFYL